MYLLWEIIFIIVFKKKKKDYVNVFRKFFFLKLIIFISKFIMRNGDFGNLLIIVNIWVCIFILEYFVYVYFGLKIIKVK